MTAPAIASADDDRVALLEAALVLAVERIRNVTEAIHVVGDTVCFMRPARAVSRALLDAAALTRDPVELWPVAPPPAGDPDLLEGRGSRS